MSRLVVFLCVLHCAVSYKVLICYPFPAKSLDILGEGIARHLLEAGHEVTYITVYPKQFTHPKLQQIDVSANVQLIENDEFMNITYLLESNVELDNDVEYLQELAYQVAVNTMENGNIRKLLGDLKVTFDVVIIDLEMEIYTGIPALYDAPLIWSYSLGAHSTALRLIDDSPNPAYSTDFFTAVYPPFSFTERFCVLYEFLKWRYIKYFKMIPKEEKFYRTIFEPYFTMRGKQLYDYEDLIYNASLVLSNDHHANGKSPSTPQNWKLVGGYHVHDPPLPLPKDLQELMDESKHGVIYFSMGSMWKSEMMPTRLIKDLLKMFGDLKQTVLWKYESELPNLPENVYILNWAPQQSILAHPNCKVFISHGGFLSSTEAIHFSVPTIGIPISYDQFVNIDKAVNRGYALKVSLTYDLAKDLKPAIESLLNNPKYKENVKALSAIYHDRPVPPGKELVHWVEHVVRSRGAVHLRSIALDVPFYQKAYLDVIVLAYLAIKFIRYILKALLPKQHRRNKKTKTK
ncbi:unnamed protein product [Diatraea saccharalis]|uniref:UDP-glucuronosyltransferase n=1 Tax=Diatraea saccharalis TaxID=40085 RepID=A0A9N9WFY1_9NEOP|nr:unnamed protein product [Diatraea saccharalis]